MIRISSSSNRIRILLRFRFLRRIARSLGVSRLFLPIIVPFDCINRLSFGYYYSFAVESQIVFGSGKCGKIWKYGVNSSFLEGFVVKYTVYNYELNDIIADVIYF